MTTLTQSEQLLLELMNRARMDPAAEGVRLKIDLNADIPAGTPAGVITMDPKQPLAGSNILTNASRSHNNAMQATKVLENPNLNPHTEAGDKTPAERIKDAGFVQNSVSFLRNENVGVQGTSAALTQDQVETMTNEIHDSLFRDLTTPSKGHRLAMMDGNMKEAGVGTLNGTFKGFNAVIATQNFGTSGTQSFISGAVYDDTDNDQFYGLGEAVQGVTARVVGGATNASDLTGAGGGWTVGVPGTGGSYTVTFSGAGIAGVSAIVEMGTINAKVDLVNRNEIYSSATTTLGAGAKELHLLGLFNVNGTGNAGDNEIVGNKGNNVLTGAGGNDIVDGAAGNDTAVFTGALSQYRIEVLSATSVRITDTRPGADGSDIVTNVENFKFADTTKLFSELRTTIVNNAPVATITDHTLKIGETVKVLPWIAYSDADGNAATQFQFRDSGTGTTSASFVLPNGTKAAAGVDFTVSAVDLANLSIRGGQAGGSETMSVRAFDGKDWSAWDTFTLTTKANVAPVATIADRTLKINETTKVSSLVTYSDADGNAPTQFQFRDGGTGTTSASFVLPNGTKAVAGVDFTVSAADLANLSIGGGQAGGSETMFVRAFDGTDWSAWDSFTLTTVKPNTAPVATIADKTLAINATSKVSSWVAFSDADGHVPVQYQFWDGNSTANGSFFFSAVNARFDAGVAITVNAADLGTISVRAGQVAGSKSMFVRAFDGTDWSAWDTFTLTTKANSAPVATIENHSVSKNEWTQMSSWLKYSDAEGNAATQYQFWDGGGTAKSGYIETSTTARNAAGVEITVAAADLDKVWVRGGEVAGTEQMFVRAFDGTAWGAWDSFNFTTLNNTLPTVSGGNVSLKANAEVAASSLFKVSDIDANAMTHFEFWDSNSNASSGHFEIDGVTQKAGQAIDVLASDLADATFVAGTGAGVDQLWMRAHDGSGWSDWHALNATTLL